MSAGAPARAVLLAALAMLAWSGCASERPGPVPGRSPLILISIDTLRSDRLPAYGYAGVETPALDRLARDAVLFERAYSHYPMTLPSHVSLLTGHLPPRHGVRDNRGYRLGAELPTLAGVLAEAGYRTGAVVSSAVLRRQTGVDRGFDFFDDTVGGGGDASSRVFPQRSGAASIAVARSWLDGVAPGEPYFLFLHLFEPHTPYDAPEPHRSRVADPYDAEIAYTDALLAGFFDDLRRRGLYDPALVILLSDHGEGLGDHGESEHGLLLYREALQVPLIVKLPGSARAGTRLAAPAGLFDVMPTVLALLGLPPRGCEGSALLGPQPVAAERTLYAETWFGRHQYGWSELQSAIEGRWHYVRAPRSELYDLIDDPAERRDLIAERRAETVELDAWLAEVGSGVEATAELTREELESLASLGYIGGAGAASGAGALPDPKDHIHEVEALWEAIGRIGASGDRAAESRVLELTASLGVRNEALFRTIAGNLLRAGRPGLALEVLAPYAASEDPDTGVTLGKALTEVGRPEEAARRFTAVLERDAGSAQARLGLGIVFLSADRPAEARPHLERAVELDPAMSDAWNGLGVARLQTGDVAGAEAAWSRAVEQDPALADAWFNLALLLRRTGRPGEAATSLRRYAELSGGADRERALALARELESEATAPR